MPVRLKISAIVLAVILSCSATNEENTELIYLVSQSVFDGNVDLNCIYTPIDLVVDSEGNVFVLDIIQRKLLVFNEAGDFLYEFGKSGEAPGEFTNLYFNFDLDDSGLVYTIDNWNRINIFNNDGSYRSSIETSFGQIFDIAAVDSNRIYVNAFPRTLQLLNTSSVPAVLLLDADGNVMREVGILETNLENPGQKKMHFSCVIDTDEDNSIYYASLADYNVAKYDSSGICIWSVIGPCSLESYSVQHEDGSSLHPIIWDLDVNQDHVFILWAQGGNNSGYRIDVLDANNGEFAGYFYTQTPSEEKNMFIEIDGNDFYTVDYLNGIIYKYHMQEYDNT